MEKAPPEDGEPADDAWKNHKRLITTLYTSWSLDEVQKHLEQHHGFHASKHMFKRKLQKWGVAKNATSDKMDLVVESLKRTNERELTQPCPDKEMIVEGYKVTLSQVKRYIRRKRSCQASHVDSNDVFPSSKQGTQPQQSFTNGSPTHSSDIPWTSILNLVATRGSSLGSEEFPGSYSLVANSHGSSTYPSDSQRSSPLLPSLQSALSAFTTADQGREPRSDNGQQLYDSYPAVGHNPVDASGNCSLPGLPSFKVMTEAGTLHCEWEACTYPSSVRAVLSLLPSGRTKTQEIEQDSHTQWQPANAAQEHALPLGSGEFFGGATATKRACESQDCEDILPTMFRETVADLSERHDREHLSNGEEDFPWRSRSKRPLPFSEADEDNQSCSSSSKQRRGCASPETSPEIHLFACPYAKFDPFKFSKQIPLEKRFRNCKTCYFHDISRLKQHLYRVHYKPDHCCPRCFSVFPTAKLLYAHYDRSVLCEKKSSDTLLGSMSTEQTNFIKRRRIGETGVQQWFTIYRILFPTTPVPLSPYVDREASDSGAELLALFRRRAPSLLSQMIKEALVVRLALDESEQQLLDDTINKAVGEAVQTLLSDHAPQKPRAHADANVNSYDPWQSTTDMPSIFGDALEDSPAPAGTLGTATPTCTVTSSEEDFRSTTFDYQLWKDEDFVSFLLSGAGSRTPDELERTCVNDVP